MPSTFMPEQVAIREHFTYRAAVAAGQVVSGFMAGLRDSRDETGRNPDTGAKIPNGKHGGWLGAIGYMALLDQIGTCFKPAGVAALTQTQAGRNLSAVEKALAYFAPTTTEGERAAIYALRCAFAHDWSLCNDRRDGAGRVPQRQADLHHRFTVSDSPNGHLVVFPTTPWGGILQPGLAGDRTTVNLQLLGDTVEAVVAELERLRGSQQLEIVLPGGSDELVERYMIWIR